MTDKPPIHMTDPSQEQNLDVLVPGAGTSGEENLAKRPCEELMPYEHHMNADQDGSNPKGFVMPPFADGKDLRVGR